VNKTDELRKLIADIGLSQREAASLLEVDHRTMRYWCSANPEPPIMAVMAMRYMSTAKLYGPAAH
jgi:DNA-binding transcriptional regulator YiaG